MKRLKFIPYIVLAIVFGYFFGNVFFSDYKDNSLTAFSEGEKLFFVQLGVYDNFENIKNYLSDYEDYLVINEEDGYHVYAGITSNKNIANRIKEFFKDQGNNIYVKEKYVNNYDFISILNEYEKITDITNNGEDLMKIEKIIISNYEEMVVENES